MLLSPGHRISARPADCLATIVNNSRGVRRPVPAKNTELPTPASESYGNRF